MLSNLRNLHELCTGQDVPHLCRYLASWLHTSLQLPDDVFPKLLQELRYSDSQQCSRLSYFGSLLDCLGHFLSCAMLIQVVKASYLPYKWLPLHTFYVR